VAARQALQAAARRGAAFEEAAVRVYPRACLVSTQPIEEPERPQDLLATFEWIGWDRIMFSTDYPHWDQDDPRYAIKVPMPEVEKQKLFRGNALAFYGLD
jgi:predicted TIM-barrel fold metal-dependent hydrolase